MSDLTSKGDCFIESKFFRNQGSLPDIKPDTPEQQQWRRETIQRLLKLAKEQAEERLENEK